jgi:hypothetical protein
MASKGELRIVHGVDTFILPTFGRLYEITNIDFEVKQRTVNKTLVSDFQDIKKRFTISWDRSYGTLYADLLEIFLEREDVTFIEVQPDLSEVSYTCLMSISESVRREIEAGDYGFTGFSIVLEEV